MEETMALSLDFQRAGKRAYLTVDWTAGRMEVRWEHHWVENWGKQKAQSSAVRMVNCSAMPMEMLAA